MTWGLMMTFLPIGTLNLQYAALHLKIEIAAIIHCLLNRSFNLAKGLLTAIAKTFFRP